MNMSDRDWLVGLLGFLVGFNIAIWWVVFDRWQLKWKARRYTKAD